MLVCGSHHELGAVIGVDLVRELSRQAVRQAELEYYIWGKYSFFPFLQLVTDQQAGGVAFYRRPTTSGKPASVRQLMLELLTRANNQWQLQQQYVYVAAECIWKLKQSSFRYSLLYYNISYYIILYHIISYYILLYYIMLYHIISYHIISYHIILLSLFFLYVRSCRLCPCGGDAGRHAGGDAVSANSCMEAAARRWCRHA